MVQEHLIPWCRSSSYLGAGAAHTLVQEQLMAEQRKRLMTSMIRKRIPNAMQR
jgi:hypothetical protein